MVDYFFDYVAKNYADKSIMFCQCPMYNKTNNYLDGYLMFTAAREHITLHIKNKEFIPQLLEFCEKALQRF